MVYCIKCGVQNSDDAIFCVNCGVNLRSSQEIRWEQRIEEWAENFGKRAEEWGEQFGKELEAECFRLPQIGAIFGFLIGAVIILAGLLLLFRWNIVVVLRSLASLAVIFIGLLITVFAIQIFQRRKS